MYSAFRHGCERLLRIPPDPEPPPGDESSTQIYRAAANYYKYLLVVWAITSFASILPLLIVAIGFSIAAATTNFSAWLIPIPVLLLIVAIAFALVHLAIVRLNYEKRWYIVTDRSLRVREGVIKVREMTITFANIQNISIAQGPIQRLLNIADLRVDTAGGGTTSGGHHQYGENLHVAWFRGIDNAAQVREIIQARLRGSKDAGLGDHEDHAIPATGNPDLMAALREVHEAATRLRETAARVS
jgi:membrane protein YdbS with pleckstrin-like domain